MLFRSDYFMKRDYPKIFEPITIKRTTIKNRIAMTPMGTNYGETSGEMSNRHMNYYSLRAKGGTGLIILENANVEYPAGSNGTSQIRIDHDSFMPRYYQLVENLHKSGATVAIQVNHAGASASSARTGMETVSSSNIPTKAGGEVPRPMTKEEILTTVKKYGEAAKRVQAIGFDAIEIHCGHSYLMSQFISPYYNKRTDEYGGDINGRLRLTLEVIAKIRELCGDDFIIDVRISGDEYSEGGLTLNDMIYVSKQLEKAGVDFIHVSGGNTIKRGSSMPAPGTSPAPHAHASEEIRKHVNIPVSTVARINEPWIAEELIANGKTDICMIGRPNLCDSEFVNKAAEGKTDDIRPCIGCGRCLTGIMFGNPISCTVNPSVESDEIKEADEKKKVLVIGAGPAGMEAAYVAKKRGHEVVLCEKSSEFGGLLRLAAVPIAKQELCKVIKFMARRLKNEGIEVRMNCEVTPEMLAGEFKDYEVVCSTGAVPKEIPPFKVFKQTMTADDVLAGRKYPGRKIVILGGGSVGCETADYLAPLIDDMFPANRDITVIEMTPSLMPGEGGAAKSQLTMRLKRKGVKIELNSQVTKVDETTITYEKDGQEYHITDADTLIFAVGYAPNKVENTEERVHFIGDCDKVGTLKDAIAAGHKLAEEL